MEIAEASSVDVTPDAKKLKAIGNEEAVVASSSLTQNGTVGPQLKATRKERQALTPGQSQLFSTCIRRNDVNYCHDDNSPSAIETLDVIAQESYLPHSE